MSSHSNDLDDAQNHFWKVVHRCLREFHKMDDDQSKHKTFVLRKKVESMPTKRMELFFHSEPFDVACDIADHQLDLRAHLDSYLDIRDGEVSSNT